MMSSPLVGSWELVSDTHQGVMVCSETHYSIVMMAKNRQRSGGDEPTPDEMIEAYRDVNALAGTYTVSGSKVIFQRVANLRAGVVGLDFEAGFTIEGDELTWRSISGTTRPREDVWRKVG